MLLNPPEPFDRALSPASRRDCLRLVAAAGLWGAAPWATAQFRVEVTGVGMTQFPFSAVRFRGNESQAVDVAAVVRADLERSGLFRALEPEPVALDEMSRPDLTPWRARGTDLLLAGSISRLADGRQDVRFRLWDVVKGVDLGGLSYPVAPADLRLAAHRIADHIYEKMTGEKGVFSTRIAYVTRGNSRHTLWVADADGEGARSALSSPEPIISPSWSPDGGQVAYVSFESRKPVVYAHELASGRRRLMANFRGINSAPAWAPDGRSLVLTLSLSGSAQLYALDAAGGGEPKRLTQSTGIDTEAVFSPDGQQIYFVSDRGGSPQIYRMPARGGEAQRVTFHGTYNISPALSPDGRWLAYVSRQGGQFRLHVMELATGQATAVTDTAHDESPSFAPNSRLIIFATRHQGREALMTTTVDGRIRSRLAGAQGDIREPEWGPFVA